MPLGTAHIDEAVTLITYLSRSPGLRQEAMPVAGAPRPPMLSPAAITVEASSPYPARLKNDTWKYKTYIHVSSIKSDPVLTCPLYFSRKCQQSEASASLGVCSYSV